MNTYATRQEWVNARNKADLVHTMVSFAQVYATAGSRIDAHYWLTRALVVLWTYPFIYDHNIMFNILEEVPIARYSIDHTADELPCGVYEIPVQFGGLRRWLDRFATDQYQRGYIFRKVN